MIHPPDGIIITISQQMLKEKGYRNWLRNFRLAMAEDRLYFMRLGSVPKHEVLYVYLCIGGKLRFRCQFVAYQGPSTVEFDDGRIMTARAWVIMTGPAKYPPYTTHWKGFRGFRYTEKLF
jgi:hypothetical protein